MSTIERTLVLFGLRFHVLCEDLIAGFYKLLTLNGILRLVLSSDVDICQTEALSGISLFTEQLKILLVVGDSVYSLLVRTEQDGHAAITVGLRRILFESFLVVLDSLCAIVETIGRKAGCIDIVTIEERRIGILAIAQVGDALLGVLKIHRFYLCIEKHTAQDEIGRSKGEEFIGHLLDRREVRLIHEREEIVLTCVHIVDCRIGCAVEELLIGRSCILIFTGRVGDVAKFLVSREVVGLALKNLLQSFFGHDGVHIFVNACTQTQSFDVVGLDVQDFIELLSCTAPVLSQHAHLCLQHKTGHILRI